MATYTNSTKVHWGTAGDVKEWSDEMLASFWQMFAAPGTWENFPTEIRVLQDEQARRSK